MSEQEATRFIKDLQDNTKFAEELHSMRAKPDAVLKTVNDRGYNVTADEVSAAFLEFSTTMMTEQNLKDVVAGLSKGDNGLIAGSVVGGVVATACIAGAAAAAV